MSLQTEAKVSDMIRATDTIPPRHFLAHFPHPVSRYPIRTDKDHHVVVVSGGVFIR
jgi:hypothetical protein